MATFDLAILLACLFLRVCSEYDDVERRLCFTVLVVCFRRRRRRRRRLFPSSSLLRGTMTMLETNRLRHTFFLLFERVDTLRKTSF